MDTSVTVYSNKSTTNGKFSQELNPETTRTGIWLRENTRKLFNIGRIPEPFCDVLSSPPHTKSPAIFSILLMLHNWCYLVPVYHSSTPEGTAKLMSPREIEKQIRSVIVDVEERLSKGEKAVPIGVLSADERDRWSEVYSMQPSYIVPDISPSQNLQHLLSLSPTNQISHQAMLHSIMGLSLDHTTYTIALSSSPSSSPQQLVLDAHLHTIRATPLNVANRFFDKAFTLMIDPSTHAGATGEHSPCDALVPSIVAEYGIVQGVDVDAFAADPNSPEITARKWERLDWVVDDKLRKECVAAEARAISIVQNSDDSVLWFDKYGTDWIKNIGK